MNQFNKPLRPVGRVFLHCTASDNLKHDNTETLHKWHVTENGWKDIGYHYVITKDGTVHACRPLETKPAAQGGYNTGTIAICLTGLNVFSAEQFTSLRQLCADIHLAYDGDITFHGHCEVANKTCPVFDYKDVLGLDDSGRLPEELEVQPLPVEKETIMSEQTTTAAPAEIKSGAKTSEFWLTLATTIITFLVTILNQIFEWSLDPASVLAAITPVLLYILGRSGVKALSK